MFDFDAPVERRGTGSMKWEGEALPMWVADMDFETAPAVKEAIAARARHGVYGYTVLDDRWYRAYANWWKIRHGAEIAREEIVFSTGVVAAISSAVKRLTNVGDNIVVLTPVYDIFFHSIENAGRHTLECPLAYDREHGYAVDDEDLERKLSHPLTTMLIFCNPHNPAGKLWTREELLKIGRLCKKYGVTLLSDEIHCDLTAPGKGYASFLTLREELGEFMVCLSASKAFNLAGLQSAAVVIPDRDLRRKVVRGLNSDEVAEPNCFAAEGTIAAFERGGEWLDELRAYLFANRTYAVERLRGLPVYPVAGEATYLLWLDCADFCADSADFCEFAERVHAIKLSAGAEYRGNGRAFVRMNLACPRARLEEGLARFCAAVEAYRKDR